MKRKILSFLLVMTMTTSIFVPSYASEFNSYSNKNPIVLEGNLKLPERFKDSSVVLSQRIIDKQFDLSIMTDDEKDFLDYMISQENCSNKEQTLYLLNNSNLDSLFVYYMNSKSIISVDHAGTALNIIIDLALFTIGEGGIADDGVKHLVEKYGVDKAKKIIEEKVVEK